MWKDVQRYEKEWIYSGSGCHSFMSWKKKFDIDYISEYFCGWRCTVREVGRSSVILASWHFRLSSLAAFLVVVKSCLGIFILMTSLMFVALRFAGRSIKSSRLHVCFPTSFPYLFFPSYVALTDLVQASHYARTSLQMEWRYFHCPLAPVWHRHLCL